MAAVSSLACCTSLLAFLARNAPWRNRATAISWRFAHKARRSFNFLTSLSSFSSSRHNVILRALSPRVCLAISVAAQCRLRFSLRYSFCNSHRRARHWMPVTSKWIRKTHRASNRPKKPRPTLCNSCARTSISASRRHFTKEYEHLMQIQRLMPRSVNNLIRLILCATSRHLRKRRRCRNGCVIAN